MARVGMVDMMWEYNGCLIIFLTGQERILEEDSKKTSTSKEFRGLNYVPLQVNLTYTAPPLSGDAWLEAGIMGSWLHREQDTFNRVPSLEPHHMWAMKLSEQSPLRRTGSDGDAVSDDEDRRNRAQ